MTEKEKYEELYRLTEKREENILKKIEKEYRIAYEETMSEIELYHRQYAKDGVLEYAEMVKYNRLKSLNVEIGKIINELYENYKTEIDADLEDNFTEAYNYTGFIMETESQTKLNFTVLPKEQIEASVLYPLSGLDIYETIDKNKDLITLRVKQAITQSIIRGLDLKKTATRIQYDLGVGYKNAVTIARTEISRTRNAGQELAYDKAKNLGLEFKKIWLSALDSRTREAHRKLDGQYADDEGYFTIDGQKALYPAGFGVASLDVNCRCSTITNLSSLKSRKAGKDIIPYQTYTEWEKNRLQD